MRRELRNGTRSGNGAAGPVRGPYVARVQAIFERVRAEAERSAWSAGVELARANAVTQERASGGERVLRVRPNDGLIHPTVLLYVDDAEWECDCGGDDPCAHVAAAVIALRRAQQEGRELPVHRLAPRAVRHERQLQHAPRLMDPIRIPKIQSGRDGWVQAARGSARDVRLRSRGSSSRGQR